MVVLRRALIVLMMGLAIGAAPATRPNAYPWDSASAMKPPRLRKAWEPVYRIDPRRPDSTMRTHDKFIGEMKSQQPAVLFVGDSITGNWRIGENQTLWKQYFSSLNAYNLGCAGDMTEHILWRMSNGELEGIHPKVVVLMAGTNNLWRDTPADIVRGVSAIVETIHAKAPEAKVVILGLLPRDDREAQPDFAAKIADVNARLAKLNDEKSVRYFAFGDKFLDQDGKLAKGFLADGLHPTPRGYEVWGRELRPLLDEVLKGL